MSVERIFEEALRQAGIRLVYPGRGLRCFVAQADMFKAIMTAQACGLWIVGIEGFEMKDGGVYPNVELIADYSGLASLPISERIATSIQYSLSFIKEIEHASGLDFIITVSCGSMS